MKILIVAPHADDEVLGCGGTIKKRASKGDEIRVCFVTQAYEPEWTAAYIKNKEKEITRACFVLGVAEKYFLGFPAAKLDSIPKKDLNFKIKEIIKNFVPKAIYIPHRDDLHFDHRLVYEACLVATRPIGKCSVEEIYTYETLSETEWGMGSFRANVFEDISDTLKYKIKAMKAYKSELMTYPHPRSLRAIKALAEKRASESGFKFAESFELLKCYRK
ncbi:MAG: LmbE family protein [Parcubacteria group bacterium Licking1014_17]|nr:MAG: LmbE family protein [Parcubacteria group bacterium Licking1014_17]